MCAQIYTYLFIHIHKLINSNMHVAHIYQFRVRVRGMGIATGLQTYIKTHVIVALIVLIGTVVFAMRLSDS